VQGQGPAWLAKAKDLTLKAKAKDSNTANIMCFNVFDFQVPTRFETAVHKSLDSAGGRWSPCTGE